MAKEKVYCHICGNQVKKVEAPTCASCGTDLVNRQVEALASQEKAFYRKGTLSSFQGTMLLTNQRIVFLQAKDNYVGYAMGGLVGAAISAAVNSGPGGKVIASIPLGDIVSVEDGKRNLIILHMRDGSSHKVMPENADQWRVYLRALPSVAAQ